MNVNKSKIAFDLDDVLVDVTRGFLNYLEANKALSPIKYQNIKFYTDDSTDDFSLGVTEKEELALWDEYLDSKEYYSLTPKEDVVTLLKSIKENYQLVILTNREERYRDSALGWVNSNLPELFSEILFTTDYPVGEREKGKVCKDLNISLLIDDMPHNILSCRRHAVSAVVYDRPWNKRLKKDIPRVTSLLELSEFI